MILRLKSVSIQSRALLLKHHSTPQLTKLMWTQIQTSIGSEVQSRMRKYFFLVAFYIWKGHKRRSRCITRPKDILMTWLRSMWRGFYNIFNGRKLQDIFLSSFDKLEKGGTLRSSLKTNQMSRACYQNTVNSRLSAVLGGTGTTSYRFRGWSA